MRKTPGAVATAGALGLKSRISARVCGSVQLYEQILAENEKLKAQLRDTDLELADLKLQLEKAAQVQAARRAPAATVGARFLNPFSAVVSEAGALR